MVEPIRSTTRRDRERALDVAGWNPFQFAAADVELDLLTDSGTGAMSHDQWAALLRGDESYAGSRSFERFRDAVNEVLGFPLVVPAHQGRGAESIFFGAVIDPGEIVPSNAHFDTTRAHIEVRQGVSLANVKEVGRLAHEHGKKFVLDIARFAENAWFVQAREPGYSETPIPQIVREMVGQADAVLMSAKKDALTNIGGFVAISEDEEFFHRLQARGIVFEGFPTYGGLAGRDLEAIAVGLREVLEEDYLRFRVEQVAYLGHTLEEAGAAALRPFGGHAVYLDAGAMLPHLPPADFPAQALACAMYLAGGVRGVEIGSVMAGRDPISGENRRPPLELVRLAVPRRVYTA